MKDFNAAYMEIKLKKGWTISEFIQDLGVSEGEFHSAMVKRFSKKLRKFYKSRLDQNQKRREKSIRNNSHKIVVPKLEEGKVIQSEHETANGYEDLETLKLREKQIGEKLSKAEDSRTFLNSKIKEEQKALRSQETLLQGLYDEIHHVETQIKVSRERISNFSNSICQVEKEISDKREALVQIQMEIKNLEKVTILAFGNEEIEAEGIKEIVIPETWKDIYQELLESDAVEDLVLKQIKQLAKVIAFVRSLDKSFDVIFESEAVQISFDKLQQLAKL